MVNGMDINKILSEVNAARELSFGIESVNNPFTPTFGKAPEEMAGRTAEIGKFVDVLLSGSGVDGTALSVTGARGTGKTVLLNCFADVARTYGFNVYSLDAYERTVDDFVDALKTDIYNQNPVKTEFAPTAFGASIGTMSFEKAIPQRLTNLLKYELEHSKKSKGTVIILDEVDVEYREQISEIAKAYKQAVSSHNVFFVYAGLPNQIENIKHVPGLTFLGRCKKLVLSTVNRGDTKRAIIDTCEGSPISIGIGEADRLAVASDGYPFAIQCMGYAAWANAARNGESEISDGDVTEAISSSEALFKEQVISAVIRDMSMRELEFVIALCSFDDDIVDSGDLYRKLGWKSNYACVYKNRLHDASVIANGPTSSTIHIAMPFLKDYINENRDVIELMIGTYPTDRYPMRRMV